ncbi:histidine kinase [Arthrobacter sp. StoSoilB22]|uniref:sensor histidine kinase n=1 Tax=Arthrobacter sp. StoSoilB22 TaxID=2830996 RepID=UPI001CC65AE9|nr:histidine kinase [Arthrobacter sp. StoSoilB22]BCW64858.1 two-component sensor histidine kinase [Arthrobacter sp. StoSoilB22]
MERTLKVVRHWGAPAAAAIFFVLWCVGEAGRMGPWPGLYWPGAIPLLMMTAVIGLAKRKPYFSLGLTGVLLLGQLVHIVPAMAANHWAIYLGSFIALGLIMWTGSKTQRIVAASSNLLFILVMTYMMISARYGDGVGWFKPLYVGDSVALRDYVPVLFPLLLVVAAACGTLGLLVSLYEDRQLLSKAQIVTEASLKETEIELVIEQERTRIARDLHDVLAHSLAVITAQADGTRYLSKGQPKPVLDALENIAVSARHALVDAQRVIEGVRDDGMVAPQPLISDVGPLMERMRQGSLEIEHSESGVPVELGAGQQLAVFRIVQECLTNALKHGGRGTAVRVHFDWSGPGLTLHASSALPASVPLGETDAGHAKERYGRGIPGMRERAHLAGGWLTAGPDGEQFRVTAFLPYGTGSLQVTSQPSEALTDLGERASAAGAAAND